MSAPVLILIGPILASVLVLLIRRWPIASSVTGAIAVWTFAAAILLFDPGQAASDGIRSGILWTLLGSPLVLQDYIRVALAFVYITFGFVFLLSLITPQGNLFITICLLTLSPLAASMIMEPFITGAIFFVIIGGLTAVLIQGKRAGSTLGSIRHLTLTVLAVPLMLIAGWMLDSGQAQYLSVAAYLLLLAILLLLLAFPFQFWLGPNVSESRSLVPVVVFGAVQLVIALFCLQMLVDNPVIYGNAQFLGILKASGVATLVIASLLVATSKSLGRLFGYLLLLDVGATILALSTGGRLGLQATIGLLMLRTIALAFGGVGLGLIQAQKLDDDGDPINYDKLAGLALRTPLGIALFIFGCLSLAGAPLTPGFSGRWFLISIPGSSSNWLSIVVVLSVALAVAGILRILPAVFTAEVDDDGVILEPVYTRLVAVMMLAFGMVITLSPRLILELAELLTNQLL
jgi:NADH:ubiquinone oxidoreductase subunit 2 (subunit N)